MEKNIKIEKITECIPESQINSHLYYEEIEKYHDKPHKFNTIGFLLAYSIILFTVAFSKHINTIILILIILLGILGILFITLYNEIIKEKFIIPMYKDLYEKGYYIYGYMKIDKRVIIIEKYTYNKNDLDKLIEEIIKKYQETKDKT